MTASVQDLTSETIDNFLDDNEISVICFGADWCQPCQTFKPIYEEIAQQQTDVAFSRIDVESQHELAEEFGIRSVPTLMIFRDNVALCRESGEFSKAAFIDLLEQAKKLDMAAVQQDIAQQVEGDSA